MPHKLAANLPKDDVIAKTTKLPKTLDERLKLYCKLVHASQSDVIVSAIQEYLDKRENAIDAAHEELD